MQDAASCSACREQLLTLSPVFLSCGDLLCDQCAPRYHQCPRGDQGIPFTPPAHIAQLLKGILKDTLEMQRGEQVRELLARLKQLQIEPACSTCGREVAGECANCFPRCPVCFTLLQASICPNCAPPAPQSPSKSIMRLPCFHPLPLLPRNPILHSLEPLFISQRDAALRKIQEMEPLRQELERRLQDKFPGCVVKAYGSGANGFTMASSDFDLTLVLPNSETDKDRKVAILRQIEPLILSQGYKVEDRLSARTPVLKCTHPRHIELDLTVGNLVAVRNSELLNTYAELDERVRALGIILKHWAKMRQIADASQGFLSSYSYIILLIAFLQRTNPPLVPNLQANYYDCEKDLVEEHDCSFDKNVRRYEEMTRDNKLGLAELLIGFFRYYGYEFAWEKACVTIRLPGGLNKAEKGWRTGFAIEDPFEMNRNLGDVAYKSHIILDEFKWAAYLFSQGADFESVCSFASESQAA